MAIIRVRNSVIDTSGESERRSLISMSYDRRIPDREKDWARYGSYEAAALVNADIAEKVARRSVVESIKAVRRWAGAKGYSEATRKAQCESNRKDVRNNLEYLRKCQAYSGKCEEAYQAMLAGAKASGA